MERTNALHVHLPEQIDLVVIDLGWTPQKLILPHALELIKPNGKIISLVKPHYEAPKNMLKAGVLNPCDAEKIFHQILAMVQSLLLNVVQWTQSPISGTGGNIEFLMLLKKI